MSITLDRLMAEYDEGIETLNVRVSTVMQIRYEVDQNESRLDAFVATRDKK